MAEADHHLRRGLVLSSLTGFCLGLVIPHAGYGAGGFFLLSIITGTLWFLINGRTEKTLRTLTFCSSIFVGIFVMAAEGFFSGSKLEIVLLIGGFIFVPTFIAAVADCLIARLRGKFP